MTKIKPTRDAKQHQAFLDYGPTGRIRYYVLGHGNYHAGVIRLMVKGKPTLKTLTIKAKQIADVKGWDMFEVCRNNEATASKWMDREKLTCLVLPKHRNDKGDWNV